MESLQFSSHKSGGKKWKQTRRTLKVHCSLVGCSAFEGSVQRSSAIDYQLQVIHWQSLHHTEQALAKLARHAIEIDSSGDEERCLGIAEFPGGDGNDKKYQ